MNFNLREHLIKKAVLDERIQQDIASDEHEQLLKSKIEEIISTSKGDPKAAVEQFIYGEFTNDIVAYLSDSLFEELMENPYIISTVRSKNYGVGGTIAAPGLWNEMNQIEEYIQGNVPGSTGARNAWMHELVNSILLIVKEYIHGKSGAEKIDGETDDAFKSFVEFVRKPGNIKSWVISTEKTGKGKQIRTEQVSRFRNSFVSIWGNRYKEIYDFESSNYPELTSDKFVILWYAKEHERYEIAEGMGLDPEIVEEVMGTIEQKLNINNFTKTISNAHDIIKLWTNEKYFDDLSAKAGAELIDRGAILRIEPEDILKAAGFNPNLITKNFKLAIKPQQGEEEDRWLNRCGLVLADLLNSSDAYFVKNPAELSKLNAFLVKGGIFPENSTDSLIQALLNEVSEFRVGHTRINILRDLLERAGFNEDMVGVLDRKLAKATARQWRPDPDINFGEIGLGCRSDSEELILNTFRNSFNIPITSYEVTINSPDNCMVNGRGFKMDFCFLADVIVNFESSGMPIVKPEIFFAGEALGFDRRTGKHLVSDMKRMEDEVRAKMETELRDQLLKRGFTSDFDEQFQAKLNGAVFQRNLNAAMEKMKQTRARTIERFVAPEGEEYASVDGDFKIWKSTDENGYENLMSRWPVVDKETGEKTYQEGLADPFVFYNIKTSWKEPYETFVTHMADSNMIYLNPIDTSEPNHEAKLKQDIANQLDKHLILWRNGEGYGYAVQYVLDFARQDPNYAADPIIAKYAQVGTPVSYTAGQLYAMTILKHFDIQHVVIPAYKGAAKSIPIKRMKQYLDAYRAQDANLDKAQALRVKSELRNQFFGNIKELCEDFISGKYKDKRLEEYQRDIITRREFIKRIVDEAMANPSMTPKEVKLKMGDAFQKAILDDKNVDWFSFPEDVINYRRAQRWYGLRR